MSGSPLALISGNAEFARPIQSDLARSLGLPVDFYSLDVFNDEGPPRTDGLWFLAPSTAEEARAMSEVARSARLQEWPAVLFALDTGVGSVNGKSLSGRFRWPGDLSFLTERVRPLVARLAVQSATPHDEDWLCRRWLRQTPSLARSAPFLSQTAVLDVVLLLIGGTGTGKTYLARALHESSSRRGKPFLVVPCGSLPSGLSESAFFGHIRGSFTGAERNVTGKFSAAGEGTILLDEIDTLSVKDQAGLLRVIETGEFEPIGSHETQRCRARILVASNVDLEEAVVAGRFREDLYYRLNALSFCVPPLRERIEDVMPLTRSLVARLARQMKKELCYIHPDVFAVLVSYPWPGNIRQLQNVLQQAVIMCRGEELLPEHLPENVRNPNRPQLHAPILSFPNKLTGTGSRLEKAMVRRALENAGNCRVRAAQMLGISRQTLYKKLKKFGLEDFPMSSTTDAIG